MQNWIGWNGTDYSHEMDLALNNHQRLICHKTQPTNQPIKPYRQQYCYEQLEYSIEPLWPDETCCHTDSLRCGPHTNRDSCETSKKDSRQRRHALVGRLRCQAIKNSPTEAGKDIRNGSHYMDSNKTTGEEARRQLHKNAAGNLEQVLAATPHKTPTVRPPASYHENYSS